MKNKGFALLELMIAFAILATVVFVALEYSNIMRKNTSLSRTVGTRDRILSAVRNFAGMPAALRNSMRAALAGIPANPRLLACAGGNPLNSCQTGVVYPLTLYAPLVVRSPTGVILGIQAVSAPIGSATPMRLDTFGVPCSTPGPDCPLLVSTSFRAQCGPPLRDASAPPPTQADLVPQAICTVADVIEVTYSIQLDPGISSADASLSSFISPVTGSVTTPVAAISGNLPQ
ncbi:prepilin-type N-terminal cleavage/methylation domain-containing protein [Bdellovibrio sp. HCB337]|uniref:prepilin-type N-terminal cleavage/methylation domain-containing protein n=1 Tax=Bdellovibrio sp. HCB337 TaxID=3394358 RepID=UPI0039A6CB5A